MRASNIAATLAALVIAVPGAARALGTSPPPPPGQVTIEVADGPFTFWPFTGTESLRFHLRLFGQGRRTLGNVHFEVHHSWLDRHTSQAGHWIEQKLLSDPEQSFREGLAAGTLDRFLRRIECGSPAP